MTDEQISNLIFTLLETVDDLGELPPEKLANDSNVLSGAAVALILIASGFSGPAAPRALVN